MKFSGTDNTREACTIKITNISAEDYLCFNFVDSVSVFQESISDFFALSVNDLFEFANKGRSLWIPLILT